MRENLNFVFARSSFSRSDIICITRQQLEAADDLSRSTGSAWDQRKKAMICSIEYRFSSEMFQWRSTIPLSLASLPIVGTDCRIVPLQ
jgi:hypothetical protein